MGRSHVRTRRDADPTGYGFALDELERPLDPRGLFGGERRQAPVEVEIGSGKGSFLVAESELRPETLFLGVERARRYWLYAADRMRRRERPNARIVRGDAREVLEAMPQGSVTGLHMYFPDPWPKRRHAHRRLLIQPEFLTACERVLAAGAPFRVVTDDPGYFDQIEVALAARPRLVRSRYEPPASANEGELAGSNFERKYRLEGRRIQAAVVVRSADEDDALADEQA
ncbi:MAG: tRNA (guanosine(46)-N7)-methyltransferase TrmB [Acidobacteriota bacterium]|nr:tRNA (guanosine(46)-N7)-methyltransferase TrmB [Acidobacteriota bacterium]